MNFNKQMAIPVSPKIKYNFFVHRCYSRALRKEVYLLRVNAWELGIIPINISYAAVAQW